VWVISATPRSLYTGKGTRYPLNRRLGEAEGQSGRVRKISLNPGFESRTTHPVASRYIDWVLLEHRRILYRRR